MPIRARLLALVAIPLLGASLFAVQLADAERQAAVESRNVREHAEFLALLSDTNVAVSRQLDGVVGGRPGTDDEGGSIASIRRLETASANAARWADPQAVSEIIATAERLQNLDVRGAAELQVTLLPLINQAASAQAAHLSQNAAGTDVADLVRASESSLALQQAAQTEAQALKELLLPIVSATQSNPLTELIGSARQVDTALTDFARNLPPEMVPQLDAVARSPEWIQYETFRNSLLQFEPSSGNGSEAEPADTGGTVAPREVPIGASGESDFVNEVFASSDARNAALRGLDQEINSRLGLKALDSEASARRALLSNLLVLAVLFSLSLFAAIVILRSIARPLASLEQQALMIGRGEIPEFDVRAGGPRDLEIVEGALSELTQGLEVVRRQSLALASGDMQAEVLDYAAPGEFGQSLQKSVMKIQHLTKSLDFQATHDALTTLPNRAAILDLLDKTSTGALEDREPTTAIMLDLDGFKQTNDMLGHPIGDELLRHAAARLRDRSDGTFVGRLGGDEFMVLLTGENSGVERAEKLARHLIAALNEPFSTTAGTVWLSAGAGVVESVGPCWLSPPEILQRVDLALLQAKSMANGEVVLFDERFNDSILERSRIQGELRVAVERNELTLFFQPIIDNRTGKVSGVEALLRWFGPDGKPIPPNTFIPAAEQSDLILLIDNWVMAEGCRTLAAWARDPELCELGVSLNISGRHVASTELVSTVAEILEETGADPALLTIEVTETELVPNLESAVQVFSQLKQLGVNLAIDDFGTGYASVAHLRRVQFDRLKIDGSFVARLDEATDRSIADLLVSLGKTLELEVVAESVETLEQLHWTWESGVTHVQGWFYARAFAADELAAEVRAVNERIRTEIMTPELGVG